MPKIRTIPTNGLVGEWKLDGNALDTSGTGNNGTATNVTYATTDRGYQSQCAVFNGSSSRMSTPSFPSLTTNFTISLWIRSDNLSKTNSYIYEKGHSGANNQHAILYGYVANTYEFFSTAYRGGSITISDTGWHHIVYTYDGASFKAYKDNVLISTAPVLFTLNYISGAFYYGGSAGGDYSQQTSEVLRFLNRALSTQEVQSLYMEGLRKLSGTSLVPLTDGMVAYYDFNGDAQDIIGGNNGTVTGATLTTDRFGNANRAYSFNGSTDYITVPNDIQITSAGSWSFWIFLNSLVNDAAFISKRDGGAGNAYQIGQRNPASSGELNVYLWNSAFGNTTSPTGYLSTGSWIKINITFDGSNVRYYKNGVLLSTQADAGSIVSTSISTRFGDDWYGNKINGKMQEIEICNRTLSDSEVLAFYQIESTRYLTPLLH